MRKRHAWVVVALLLILPVSLAIAGGQTEKPKSQFVAGFASIVRSLDPAVQICGEEGSLEWSVYDNLVTYDRKDFNTLRPSLAEKWEASPDRLTWTFHLRKGVKFTTGNEVTADDVVYSFKRGMRINHPNYPRFDLYLVNNVDEAIKKIDTYTVQLKLKKPFTPFGMMLTNSHCGIIDSKTLEKNISSDDPDGTKYLNDHSLGTGPYMLEEWKRNEYVRLVRNPTYWGIPLKYFRVPRFDVLIDRNIPESSVQKMMLDRGESQMAFNLTGDMVMEYEKNPNVQVVKNLEWTATAVLMNPGRGILRDQNVRRAIRWAIDYKSIINDILKGYAITLERPFWKPFIGSLKDGDKLFYYHDLAKAKEFMAKSKYPQGGEFTLVIGTGGGFGAPWEVIAQKEASDLAAIGIKVKIEQYDWSVVDEKSVSGDYDAMQIWTGISVDEAAGNVLAHAHTSESFFIKPLKDYRNAKIDELCDKAEGELDPKVREQLYLEVSRLHEEDGPYAWVAQQLTPYVFPKDIKGFDKYPGGYNFDFSVLYKE
jgi:peptide/nickel transport system substrate-binding protein